MLDVSVRAGVLKLLDGLRRSGLAILMITHDLSTAARFADRIAVMYLGRIVEEGPAAEVVREPAASVHEGAALGRAAPRPARADQPRDPARRDARRGADPERAAASIRAARWRSTPAAEDPVLRDPVGTAAGHEAACILLTPRE